MINPVAGEDLLEARLRAGNLDETGGRWEVLCGHAKLEHRNGREHRKEVFAVGQNFKFKIDSKCL